MTEDEVVGWHHRLNGHEFAQTLGDSEGQGSLVCYSPWGHRESDTDKQLNNIKIFSKYFLPVCGLSFHSVDSVFFQRRKFLYFNEVQLIIAFVYRLCLWRCI